MSVEKLAPPKSRFGLWGWVIPVGLATISAANLIYMRLSLDMYRPGNWLGETSFLPGLENFLVAFFCGLGALITAFIFRPRDLFHVFWPIGLGLFVWILMGRGGPWEDGEIRDLPRALARYKVESAEYKKAVQRDTPFGDEYAAQSGGRELNYWRWAQYDIDNAVGVIYDPLDKYPEIEGDQTVFEGQTHGRVWRTKRVEPHWILVWHS